MDSSTTEAAPVLSTPDTHIFEYRSEIEFSESASRIDAEQLYLTYEIERTLIEIRREKYARVALQFPDSMLRDAPRISEALSKGLNSSSSGHTVGQDSVESSSMETDNTLGTSTDRVKDVRVYILADTSYGACCVDEIAAEHMNADVIVHYGRACLSPTARIPVIHIFTIQPLPEMPKLIKDFEDFYLLKDTKIILMSDVTYQCHIQSLTQDLRARGYSNLVMTEIVHDPSSALPNRAIPLKVENDPLGLKDWHLFHLSSPPDSLLLSLASRLASIRIYPISDPDGSHSNRSFLASTNRALSRRYALLTSVGTASIFGILINTLSVRNYIHMVEHVKSQINSAGKKSYTFVVGKVNAAKVANFSEIGGWVVIGCWESSLIDSKDFWKPVLTPFELELALKSDEERVWTGQWTSDFQKILDESDTRRAVSRFSENDARNGSPHHFGQDPDSEPESTPPEFDLRTGRYVAHSRPMRAARASGSGAATDEKPSNSMIMRAKGDLAVIGGDFSPGAEHLRTKRTWKGLGSDFKIAYEQPGTAIEEGRGGVARGYTHGAADYKT